MASKNVSSLAVTCIELYYLGREDLVGQFVLSYSLYISLCLIACLIAAISLMRRKLLDETAKNAAAEAALLLRIPFLPHFDQLLFLAPLFLAISNLLLLLVRIHDIRARPFPYSSQAQFQLAASSSKIFAAFFAVAPVATLFSSLARMAFMFRLVLLCHKIGTSYFFRVLGALLPL
jgi:hypothetical protein